MKGKYHLLSGVVFLVLLFIIDFFVNNPFINFLSSQNFFVIFFIFYLFFAGILLPDSDKLGSNIFKFFLPFAIISWLIGFLFSTIRGKQFKHRGFLHSPIGIVLTSITSGIVCFFFLSIFFSLSYWILIVFILSALVGQTIHLALD